MKIIILKNCLFFIVCLTSSFSYLYLNNQSSLLNKNQTKNVVIDKQNLNLNTKGIQEEHTKDKTYSDKQKNDLPDIELFEYFIRKATEGVPLLKFEGFWNLFE